MLDTVALTLDPSQFRVTAPEKFDPPLYSLYKLKGTRITFQQNPGKEAGAYYPHLTIRQRPTTSGDMTHTLRIEFSAPKLLFGNNFDELHEHQFPQVIDRLWFRLQVMGVLVTRDILSAAEVSAIHYSKNLLFTDGITSQMLIRTIGTANATRRREVNLREYRDGGYAFRWHTNSYDVIYYDKVADIEKAGKTEKGRFEPDNWVQLPLFEELHATRPFETLRMEVRIGNRTKLRSLLKGTGLPQDTRFEALFNQGISRSILLNLWDEMEASLPPPSTRITTVKSRLARITENGTDNIRSALAGIALERLIQEEGTAAARDIITSLSNTRSWQRLHREVRHMPSVSDTEYSAIKKAGQQLRDFKPVSLKQALEL